MYKKKLDKRNVSSTCYTLYYYSNIIILFQTNLHKNIYHIVITNYHSSDRNIEV